MSHFVVDVEADGPAPGLYSMVSVGIVRLDEALVTTYFGQFAPITDAFLPSALAVVGVTREEHLSYPRAEHTTLTMIEWLQAHSRGRAIMISDNPAFDWGWINYYAHRFGHGNPFGHSARRIGDFYAGLERDFGVASRWKSLRKTRHSHHPVDDAKGNAEALIEMAKRHEVHLPLHRQEDSHEDRRH
jgi:hypothetical protein